MVSESTQRAYLARIAHSLERAGCVFSESPRPADNRAESVKELELALSRVLRETLVAPGEGWLCEEHADDADRLRCEAVWVVDPMDGTIEFISGLPEWSISVGLVITGTPVAGGIYNPATQELFLGAADLGVTYNGQPAKPCCRSSLSGARVLASRQELNRGDWARFQNRGFQIEARGSVAYKLALVSAGLADATWTLCPKHEWDVAAGVALVHASGGRVSSWGEGALRFNRKQPLLPGLVASGDGLWSDVTRLLAEVAFIQA
jgi:myo-inositol-1(or 4)-monophosphatase